MHRPPWIGGHEGGLRFYEHRSNSSCGGGRAGAISGGSLDGGGIVNESNSFGIWNHSEPNILGFNCVLAAFADGGLPCPPQFIDFAFPVSRVSLHAAGATGPITVTAYDASDNVLDSQILVLGDWMHDVEVSCGCITRVAIETGYPSSTPGCTPASATGCGGCECESCVCDLAPNCCDAEWGWQCADLCMSCGQVCAPWLLALDDLCFE